MEITLEKIELVKDRTGVSYKEAKEALEAADGSVVDAIIAIEETVNIKSGSKAGDFADETVEKVKELVKKGNVTKISVKKRRRNSSQYPCKRGSHRHYRSPLGSTGRSSRSLWIQVQDRTYQR